MKHSFLLERRACAWIAALFIAGCGGGGGGDSAGAGSVSNVVTVGAPTPGKIVATRVVGDSMGLVKLTGDVTGNIDSLLAKAPTVMVEDPSQLFWGTAGLTLVRNANGATYELVLNGQRPLSDAGHLTGNLRVLACVDAACQQTLAGTPLTVPYDVTVEDGLTVSRDQVNLSVPFGTVPAVENVTMGWSSSGKGWWVDKPFPTNPFVTNYVQVMNGYGGQTTERQLQLKMLSAPPGTYTGTMVVKSYATLNNGNRVEFEKPIAVNYTVSPNPDVDYVFSPAGPIELTHSASNPLISYYNYQIVLNSGVSATRLGVDYLSGAGTQGPATSWWEKFTSSGDYETCDGNACLVPGEYTAQVRYRITSAKGSYDITIPIKMTVTP